MKVRIIKKTVEVIEVVTDDTESGIEVSLDPAMVASALQSKTHREGIQSYLKNIYQAYDKSPVGFESHDL